MRTITHQRLLIFASGTPDGGGSGAEKLLENAFTGVLQALIVGLVSNYESGGVFHLAHRYNIPFFHLAHDFSAEKYQRLVVHTQADVVALSGWLKMVRGLDRTRTINIHPAPLPQIGGKGMYGEHALQATIDAFKAGTIQYGAVCMHFVTDEIDGGPTFFEHPIYIHGDDTVATLKKRTSPVEHGYQPLVTNLVVTGQISWDGIHEVIVPEWYRLMPFCPTHIIDNDY